MYVADRRTTLSSADSGLVAPWSISTQIARGFSFEMLQEPRAEVGEVVLASPNIVRVTYIAGVHGHTGDVAVVHLI
jgi:hypothetical protein